MGKKGNQYGRSGNRKFERESRDSKTIALENAPPSIDNEDNGDDFSDSDELYTHPKISVNICLWEFGQNDPKRDSGSKMCRLGYASRLKIGQSFPGIVLSSEASVYASPADKDIVEKFGIAGINCSWNRLEEIPFDSMGKGRNQRLLPLLFAANSVNYGRPYKMNTAEATAACLYITGFKQEAVSLLSPFGYGTEFLRLNHEALEAYSNCRDTSEIAAVIEGYVQADIAKQQLKECKRASDVSNTLGGYMDDMDLPPMGDSDGEEWEEEEEDVV